MKKFKKTAGVSLAETLFALAIFASIAVSVTKLYSRIEERNTAQRVAEEINHMAQTQAQGLGKGETYSHLLYQIESDNGGIAIPGTNSLGQKACLYVAKSSSTCVGHTSEKECFLYSVIFYQNDPQKINQISEKEINLISSKVKLPNGVLSFSGGVLQAKSKTSPLDMSLINLDKCDFSPALMDKTVYVNITNQNAQTDSSRGDNRTDTDTSLLQNSADAPTTENQTSHNQMQSNLYLDSIVKEGNALSCLVTDLQSDNSTLAQISSQCAGGHQALSMPSIVSSIATSGGDCAVQATIMIKNNGSNQNITCSASVPPVATASGQGTHHYRNINLPNGVSIGADGAVGPANKISQLNVKNANIAVGTLLATGSDTNPIDIGTACTASELGKIVAQGATYKGAPVAIQSQLQCTFNPSVCNNLASSSYCYVPTTASSVTVQVNGTSAICPDEHPYLINSGVALIATGCDPSVMSIQYLKTAPDAYGTRLIRGVKAVCPTATTAPTIKAIACSKYPSTIVIDNYKQ